MMQNPGADASLPFEPQVSPEQAFQHEGWRQARNSVLKALAEGRLAILVGERGAGKTLLLRELERTLCAAGIVVRRDGPDGAAEPVALDVVRLVDEADLLDDATLLRLASIGKATVLVVLPHSVDRMTSLPGQVAPTRLAPLSRAEVDDFVAAALVAAGRSPTLFSITAVAALAFFSKRLPGPLNALGRAALLRAEHQGAPQVRPEHVRRAAEDLPAGTVPPAPLPARHPEAAIPPQAEAPAEAPAEAAPAPVAAVVRQQPRRLGRGRLGRGLALLIVPGLVFVLAFALTGWLLPERPQLASREEPLAATAGGTPANSARPVPEGPPLSLGEGRAVPNAEGPNAEGPNAEGPNAEAPNAEAPNAVSTPAAPAPPAGSTAAQDTNPAAAAGPPSEVPLPARREAPQPARPMAPAMSGTFRGTTFNETLGRGGGLQLAVTRAGQGDAVTVRFEASRGLVGTGQLAGRLSPDGRLVASGTLMMGANPFATEIDGTISGDRLVGRVRYTRVVEPGGRPSSTRGSFRLARE